MIGSEPLEVPTVGYGDHKVRSYEGGLEGAETLPDWFIAKDYR